MKHEGFPTQFEQRMRGTLGEEWESFASIHEKPSPVSIRVNNQKLPTHTYDHRVPWTSSGYYLDNRPVFTLDPIFHAGAYYVQEASSMFLEQAILQATDYKAPLNVLDLCAAPGGKSTHLVSLLSRESLLVSNEVIRSRAPIVAENLVKWGYPNVVVTSNDPKDFQRVGGMFDVVVVDAPCSGEGMFRKDPGAMKEWSVENVLLCANRQKRILKDVWPALKRNGILVYSTCTYNENENEDVLEWLNESEEVEFVRLKLEASWKISEVKKNSAYGYKLFPHRTQGEGFFMAVVRKLSGNDIGLRSKKTFATPDRKIADQVREWLRHPESITLIQRKDQLVQAIPVRKEKEIELLSDNLYIISAGTMIGTLKHGRLIPDHALALSVELKDEKVNVIELDQTEALKYLRKDTLPITDTKRGFAVVRFNGISLGWVNVLDGRINNLYPAQWRIRMQDRKE